MSRILVQDIGEGQHPSERMIAVHTADGVREVVIVDAESVENSTIDVGFPVGSAPGRFLIELPRETASGTWRIWVNRSDLREHVPA